MHIHRQSCPHLKRAPITSFGESVSTSTSAQQFASLGYAIVTPIFTSAECDRIAAQLAGARASGAGTRALLTQPWCRELAANLRSHTALAHLIPAHFVAAQCTYFEKSQENNWLVAIHQDIAIPVAARVAHPALTGWSEKEGVQFVNAPVALLQQLVAVRIHVDACGTDDGPLRVMPGSHLRGRISAAEGARLRESETEVDCPVERGGAMVLSPLLLHASSKTRGESQRRVLHFLFGPAELPFGLAWPPCAVKSRQF